jgi:hypothetical protein
VPEQRREQECGRDAAILAHAQVGVGERELDEALSERLLENDVDQRQQSVRQAVRAQALHRLRRVTGQQELLHLVEESRGRNVLHQRREIRYRRGSLRIDRDAELRREPHRPQHAHRIFAQAASRAGRSIGAAGSGCR